jgi:23S rRNA (cytosine1962-C5)-methyltransferase
MERINLTTKAESGYELLDAGEEAKLERFGDIVLSRPDPQALWEKTLPQSEWDSAAGTYEREGKDGRWTGSLPKEWRIEFGGFSFFIRPTSFKHTGLFPEQEPNWRWIEQRNAKKVLNLFGYTGGASLAAAKSGAEVTHVDASKVAVAWARENAKISGLEDKPIRWIIEDVLTFVRREIKRGNTYDAVIMDPPAFGRGPSGELWKIEENFLELMKLLPNVLTEKPNFILVNGYAAGYSPLAFAYNLEPIAKKFGGRLEYGDLAIAQKGSERVLPCGIFARWSA